VFDGIVIAGPALRIQVNPRALARYGLTTADIHAAVEPAVTGTVAGQVRVGDRMYDLRVFVKHDDPLSTLRIRPGGGSTTLLPLSELATISTGEPEAEIKRENLATLVGVTARLGAGTWAARSRRSGGASRSRESRSHRGCPSRLAARLLQAAVLPGAAAHCWRASCWCRSSRCFGFANWRAPLVTSACAAAVPRRRALDAGDHRMTLNIASYGLRS
jgi:hypothetical protein